MIITIIQCVAGRISPDVGEATTIEALGAAAGRRHRRQELQVARQLQASMLPLPGRLVHANGGHGAPPVTRAGKAWPLPIPKGSLLGVIPGLRYRSSAAVLERGAALICYTDGVTEAESDAGEEFSVERLISVSAANSDRPVEELLDAARGELDAFIGHRSPDDDCTLLAVRRTRSSATSFPAPSSARR
jgi:hypothetical protein